METIVNDFYLKSYPAKKYFSQLFTNRQAKKFLSLESMGFKPTGQSFPSKEWKTDIIKHIKSNEIFPSIQGTSRLSVHLRFGTISIRELARKAGALNETFLNELIWRDFYQTILWHFPQVVRPFFQT